ncbi:hypothetical protein GCM10011408_38220 [Dyella caseinilytica]|nr:hypothetical protein GCM10011408_38220 [Dyella caseinilytica]
MRKKYSRREIALNGRPMSTVVCPKLSVDGGACQGVRSVNTFDAVGRFLVAAGFVERIEEGGVHWIGTWSIYELPESGDWQLLLSGRLDTQYDNAQRAKAAAHDIGMEIALKMVQSEQMPARYENKTVK